MKHMQARFPDQTPPLGHYVYNRRLICPISVPWTCVWLPQYCRPNTVTAGVLPCVTLCHAYRHSADNLLSSHAALLAHICPHSIPHRCRHCAHMVQSCHSNAVLCVGRRKQLSCGTRALLWRVSAARIPSFTIQLHECLSGNKPSLNGSEVQRQRYARTATTVPSPLSFTAVLTDEPLHTEHNFTTYSVWKA